MLNNYFNPNAAKPASGWQPQGALGGYQWARDRDLYEKMMGLQALMGTASLDRQVMENETYRQDDPVRAAERPAKISGFDLSTMQNKMKMGSPNYLQSMLEGEIGDNQFKAARGKEAQGTVDSTIQEKNLSNLVKMMEGASNQLSMAAASNPLFAQSGYTQVLQQLPSQVRQQLPQAYTPDVPQRLKALADSAKNSVAYRRELEKQREALRSAEYITEGNNLTSLLMSQDRLEASMYNGMSKQQKEGFDRQLGILLEKVSQGKATEQEMATLRFMFQFKQGTTQPAQQSTIDPNILLYWLMNQQRQGGAPTPPPNRDVPPPPPIPGAAASPNTSAPVTQNDVGAAGWAYEPDKYEYVRDPQNPARIGRRLKGK